MHRRELLAMLSGLPAVPALERWSEAHPRPTPHAPHPQHALIERIAELIIPETDTPGATTVRVADFIDHLVANWYEPAERERFTQGLANIEARAGRPFLELSAAEQTTLLETLDVGRAEAPNAEWAFAQLKSLTVYGYFTSEVVRRDVLRVNIMPGRFDGCAPIAG